MKKCSPSAARKSAGRITRPFASIVCAYSPMSILITGQFFSELYPFATDYLLLEKGKILKRYTREALQSRIPEDLHRTQELEEAFKAIRKEDLGA